MPAKAHFLRKVTRFLFVIRKPTGLQITKYTRSNKERNNHMAAYLQNEPHLHRPYDDIPCGKISNNKFNGLNDVNVSYLV